MKTIEEIAALFGDEVAVRIDEAEGVVDLEEVRKHDETEKTTATQHVEKL